MATHTTVTLVDDIDATEAVETVEFALDGATYEIDLNAKNAQKLRAAFSNFVDNGRHVARQSGQAPRRRSAGRHSPEHLKAVREWARANGYEVSDRARIAINMMDAYQAAH
ncbi:MAG: histone-like nucleoid-structuring protein Lsr2 [Nakamurella sp.]